MGPSHAARAFRTFLVLIAHCAVLYVAGQIIYFFKRSDVCSAGRPSRYNLVKGVLRTSTSWESVGGILSPGDMSALLALRRLQKEQNCRLVLAITAPRPHEKPSGPPTPEYASGVHTTHTPSVPLKCPGATIGG